MRDRSSFLGSRVARRVFWLFVASALLPLALSDWLATSVVSELARSLQERSQTRATRQTALQVFDRLAAARGTLELLAASAVVPSGPGADSRQRTRDEQIFDRLARVDGALADRGDGRDLLDSWRRAGDGAEGAARIPRADGDGVATVSLRVAVPTGDSPQVLMASSQGGTIRWVGELRPSYLWSPVVQSVIDSGWLVTDSHGRVLARHGDDGLIPAARETSAETRDAGTIHRTSLFLGADFAAGDWVFTQQTLPTEALWHGAPLGRWLAMVAGGTLLMIALVSLGQIRRILVPLEALTLATRRLASGESRTHVQIAGTDEFTALGQSFNEMAARIDEQFRSLAGLASIDRDVLDGAPIETVARRVIEQLVSAHADVAVAILWLDGELEGSLARLVRAPGEAQATLDSASLTADEARAFADLAQDEVTRPTVLSPLASSLPCCDNDHGDVALLPLRWNARTGAALVLRLGGSEPSTMLNRASELRDRLAVAFSARMREKEMVSRAGHDSLTGLANRHGLNEFVDAMLSGSGPRPSAAVLFIDLDNFKDANDSLGHETGDEVLCEASRRLGACAPHGALVARQGGDEFVLVLAGADEARARTVAIDAVNSLARPFRIGSEMHTFGASVGVALCPTHGTTRHELLRHADMAMYAAKAAGRGRYAFFEPSLEVATQRRLRIPGELRRALEQGELVAHYQPRVCPNDRRITSAEALVRWQHPERGLLMPGTFIALAEESRLIEDIGLFMLNDACARMGLWHRQFRNLGRISVNVSARQLLSGDLPMQVAATLKRHALPARHLELEVTESLLVDPSGNARAQLAELRRLGVSIALDDFGTGYSSMAMLKNLPIDVMKIDRAFVVDLVKDSGALAITRTIATLAHALDLHLVAEGVENEQQAALLGAMDCDEFQGHLYAKALPADAFAQACAAQSGWKPGVIAPCEPVF